MNRTFLPSDRGGFASSRRLAPVVMTPADASPLICFMCDGSHEYRRRDWHGFSHRTARGRFSHSRDVWSRLDLCPHTQSAQSTTERGSRTRRHAARTSTRTRADLVRQPFPDEVGRAVRKTNEAESFMRAGALGLEGFRSTISATPQRAHAARLAPS